MPAHICLTCGVQYPPSEAPPERCPICEDERQYVGWQGQQWTSLEEMAAKGHHSEPREEEPALISINTVPRFAIGQRALLARTPAGNVLWDCLSYIDEATVAAVRELGGVQAIAISHPHYYGVNVEWSRAFDDAPVYLHAADREWVMRPDPCIVPWDGDVIEPVPGVSLIRLGGHFEGATVLHVPGADDGRGAVLVGDTIFVVQDRRYVSFMYSYPNLIPLAAVQIEGMVQTMRRFRFEKLYGAWDGRVVASDGMGAIERSARRYIDRIR
ncbi:MAG: MBL fold metallo-hydrolase [Chloroflexi bacterium]|nr:MBL fold metallo-hydrolase [Chloroflexota bacterium]